MTMLYSPELREPAEDDWQDYLETIETDDDYRLDTPLPEYEDDEPAWDEDIPF